MTLTNLCTFLFLCLLIQLGQGESESLSCSDNETPIPEESIYKLIMGQNSTFSKLNRPVQDSRKPVIVNMGLRLMGVQELVLEQF